MLTFYLKKIINVKGIQIDCLLHTHTHTHTHTHRSLSRVRLFATPWSVAHQAPRSMGFSRHEYYSES